MAAKGLNQFTPSHPEESSGAAMAAALNIIPSEQVSTGESIKSASSFISNLPNYFRQLSDLIANNPVSSAAVSSGEARVAEYRAKELEQHLHGVSNENSLFRVVGLVGSLNALFDISKDLVRQGVPLTQNSYNFAKDQLNKLKHEVLPVIIAEVEKLEENMGLAPGKLSGPVLQQLESYYSQLANQVFNLKYVAEQVDNVNTLLNKDLLEFARKVYASEGTKDIDNVKTLFDEEFVRKRQDAQIERLHQARFEANDSIALDAANRFFDRLGSYSTYWNTNLAHLSQADKELFKKDYKLFQSFFAAAHPEMDKLIVEALNSTDRTYASRLMNVAYNRVWSGNHFKQIMECKKGVIASIKQGQAQAAFKAKRIEESIAQAQKTTPADTKTALPTIITAYKVEPYRDEPGRSPEYYHERVLQMDKQLYTLRQAEESAKNFFDLLKKIPPGTSLHTLPESQKEPLRKAYKGCQAVLLGSGIAHTYAYNQRIVSGLSSDKTDGQDVTVAKVLDTEKRLMAFFAEQINTILPTIKTAYQDRETNARTALMETTLLTEKGPELEKQTLFGQINQLKLADQFKDFLQNKMPKYFSDNLSNHVWSQLSPDGKTIDMSKLPFQNMHLDSQEVAMYKKIINSMYHMQRGLAKLEALHNYGDPEYLPNRSRYVWDIFSALALEINNAKYYLQEAAKNPGLTALIQENLKLLEPMSGFPIIGDYLKSSNSVETAPPEPIIDIVAAWKEQQNIKRGIPSVKMPVAQDLKEAAVSRDKTDSEPKNQETRKALLQQFAEQLYKLPSQIKHRRMIGPQTQEESDAELTKKAEGLVNKLGGLSFNTESVQHLIAVLNDLQNQALKVGDESRGFIIERLGEIRSEYFKAILSLVDNSEFHLGLKPGALSQEAIARFDVFYQSFIQNLNIEAADQKALQHMVKSSLHDERLSYEEARLAQIESSKPDTNKLTEVFSNQFGALKTLQNNEAQFADEKEKIQLLTIYQQLQPYLVQINYKYDTTYFLRALDKPEDFKKALTELLAQDSELAKFITSINNGHELKKQLCQERIDHIREQIKAQAVNQAPLVEQFKEKKLFALIHAELKAELGPFTAAFMKQIDNDLQKRKEGLIERITLDDPIEQRLQERLKNALPDIQKRHAVLHGEYKKSNDVLNQINKEIEKEQPTAARHPLIKAKHDALKQLQQEILANPSPGDPVAIYKRHTECSEKYQELLRDYQKLMAIQTAVGKLIEHLYQKSDGTSKEILPVVQTMQRIIIEEARTPQKCLKQLKDHVEKNMATLEKSSDSLCNRIIKFINKVLNVNISLQTTQAHEMVKDLGVKADVVHFKEQFKSLKASAASTSQNIAGEQQVSELKKP